METNSNGLHPVAASALDLIDSQEAAQIMGKTYRQFTAYASYHKLRPATEQGGSPLYERGMIQDHADIATGRVQRGRSRQMPSAGLRVSREAEEAEQKPLPSASSALTSEASQLGFATRLLSGVLTPLTAVLGDLAGAIRELKTAYPAAVPVDVRPAPLPAPVEDRLLIEDRLLTAEQAAELLACSPRSVSRYVTPVRPRTWRYSDCQRYIERLGEALEEAQRETAK